jgi:hypothetical protein
MVLRSALRWVITQRLWVISYRNFGTTLKMVPKDCPETSVRSYHYSLSNNPEERSSQLLRGGSLKSHVLVLSEAAPEGYWCGRDD